MTKNRDRKRIIRARMATTGEPYCVARRAIEGGRSGYWRTTWWRSGWTRLLPEQATFLEIAVTTTTALDEHATLEQAIDRNPARGDLPQGLHTKLTWGSDDDDPETVTLRTNAQRHFTRALRAQQLDVPATVEELAHTLAELGVFERSSRPDQSIVWTSPEELPDPFDVLDLDASWVAHEEDVRWRTVTAMPSEALCRELHTAGRPDHLNTSIEHLATTYDRDHDQIRDALDGMLYLNWAAVNRHDRHLDRRALAELPEHARFRLELNWRDIGKLNVEDGDFDLSKLQWLGTPWAIYQGLSGDARLDSTTLRVAGELPFRVVKPTGGQFTTSLGEIASAQASSIERAAQAFAELERHGLLSWDPQGQQAVIHQPGDRRTRSELVDSIVGPAAPRTAT